MRTFAQRPQAGAKATSAKPATYHPAHDQQSRAANPIQRLQHAMDDQAVQQPLEANAAAANRATTRGPAFAGFDFSRISVHPPGRLQTKLKLGAPGDSYEQEADRVADQVMRIPEPARPSAGGYLEGRNTQDSHERVQTKRAQANDTSGAAVPPIVHEVLRSPGQPLDPATRNFMEPRFGHDFSRVRVHADAKAAESASSIGARAFTSDRNIVFGAGEYAPQAQSGRRLLSHELTHVVQQGQTSEPGYIFCQQAPASATPSMSTDDKGEATLAYLLAQITDLTGRTKKLRQQQLEQDVHPNTSPKDRADVSSKLDAGRTDLIPLLRQRIALLNTAIGTLPGPAGGPSKSKNSTLNVYELQLKQHQDQLKLLLQWQTRTKISLLNAQIADIDTTSADRAELTQERDALVLSLSLPAADPEKKHDKKYEKERLKRLWSETKATHIGKKFLNIAGSEPEVQWGSAKYDAQTAGDTITLNEAKKDSLSDCEWKQVIALELGNFANQRAFGAIDKKADEGGTGRDEYEVAYEKLEFASRNAVINAYDAGEFGEGPPRFQTNMTFEQYMSANKDHAEQYGRIWDEEYKKKYENKHKHPVK